MHSIPITAQNIAGNIKYSCKLHRMLKVDKLLMGLHLHNTHLFSPAERERCFAMVEKGVDGPGKITY